METTQEERDGWAALPFKDTEFGWPLSFQMKDARRLIRDVDTILEALEAAQAVNIHRHFCEECAPARGCGEFYALHSRALARAVLAPKP